MMNIVQNMNAMEMLSKRYWMKMSPCIVLLILEIFFEGRWFINVLTLICIDIKYFYTDLVSESATQAEIDHHLELGKQYLAKGQLSDALSHYHEAVGMFL